jgi:hypothetical protein
MEPQKRARYSKCPDAKEIEEISMEEESDEELEELNEFIEPRENMSISSSSSGNKAGEEIRFRASRTGDSPKALWINLTGWQIVMELPGRHGNGQINYFSAFWT